MIERLRSRIPSRPAMAGLIALLVLYPWFYHHVLPQSSQWIPDTSTAFVIASGFIIAVGLGLCALYIWLGLPDKTAFCSRFVLPLLLLPNSTCEWAGSCATSSVTSSTPPTWPTTNELPGPFP